MSIVQFFLRTEINKKKKTLHVLLCGDVGNFPLIVGRYHAIIRFFSRSRLHDG